MVFSERFVQTSSQCIYKELEGRDDEWDLFVPTTQFAMNIKVSKITKCTPYSLMFARPINGFQRQGTTESELLDPEEITRRLNYMTTIVYPEVSHMTHQYKIAEADKFNGTHRIDVFQRGAQVMAIDELRSSKTQPRYTGPFTVLRRNQGGAYVLKGSDGTEYTRPPRSLKLFYQPAVEPGEAAVVGSVLAHRKDSDTGNLSYLVKWKNQSDANNEWVKASDFHDLTPITRFWKKQKAPDVVKPKKKKRPAASLQRKIKQKKLAPAEPSMIYNTRSKDN